MNTLIEMTLLNVLKKTEKLIDLGIKLLETKVSDEEKT